MRKTTFRLAQMLFVFGLLLGMCSLTARATEATCADLACTAVCNTSSYVSGENVFLNSLGGADAWADFQVIVPDTHYVGIESEWSYVSYINWSLDPSGDGYGSLVNIDNNTDDSATFSEGARCASTVTYHYVLQVDVEGRTEQGAVAPETHHMDIYVKFVDFLITFSKSELRPGIGGSRSEKVTVLVDRATSEDVTIDLTTTSDCSSGAATVSPGSFVSTSSNPSREVTVEGVTESAKDKDLHLNAVSDMDTGTVVTIPVTVVVPASVGWQPLADTIVGPVNRELNAGTSPVYTGDPGPGMTWLATVYTVEDPVVVYDQFGQVLSGVYKDAGVEEQCFEVFGDNLWHSINRNLDGNGKYGDPIGSFPANAGSIVNVGNWEDGTKPPKPFAYPPSASQEPRDVPEGSDYQIDVNLRIDSFECSLQGRTVHVTGIKTSSSPDHYWKAKISVDDEEL